MRAWRVLHSTNLATATLARLPSRLDERLDELFGRAVTTLPIEGMAKRVGLSTARGR